jgi:hypothetical protein
MAHFIGVEVGVALNLYSYDMHESYKVNISQLLTAPKNL